MKNIKNPPPLKKTKFNSNPSRILLKKSSNLMCTHCGGKVMKPVTQVEYLIYCIYCFRPLELPVTYYTNNFRSKLLI